jgi:hypothetical protein
MASNFHGGGSQSPTSLSKPIERVFEDAQHTGEISLSCRKLREYPNLAAKYDLIDTISAGQASVVIFFSILNDESSPLLLHILLLLTLRLITLLYSFYSTISLFSFVNLKA